MHVLKVVDLQVRKLRREELIGSADPATRRVAYWALNSTLSEYVSKGREGDPDFAPLEVSEAGRDRDDRDLDPAEGARAAPAATAGQLGVRRVRRRPPRVRRARAARHLSLPRRAVMTRGTALEPAGCPGRRRHRARPGDRGQPLRLPPRRHRPDDHEVPAGRPQPAQRRRDVGGSGRELAPRPLRLSRRPAGQRPAARLTGRRPSCRCRAASPRRPRRTTRCAGRSSRGGPTRARPPGNITLLYVAGHGIQTSNEGGILLLQDVGHPDFPALDRALDVASIRRGMVGDPTDPETSTPPVQYYFYDACRVQPPGVMSFEELQAGLTFDVPRGLAPDMSWVLWGSRSRDFALADPETRATLFSKALLLTLESRAPADKDGRTVRFGLFQMELETAVDELAAEAERAADRGARRGREPVRTPIYLRPRHRRRWTVRPATAPRPPGPSGEFPTTIDSTPRGDGPHRRRRRPRHHDSRPTESGADVLLETTTEGGSDLQPGAYTSQRRPALGRTPRGSRSRCPTASTPMDMWLEVPAQQPQTMAEAPRLGRQLGPSGGADARWYLRFLSWTPEGLRYRPENTPPAVEVDDVATAPWRS